MRSEQEILYEVLQKAWEDSEFRKRLVQNPMEEIERLTGARVVLPQGKTLVVNDQTDDSKFYLNIPKHPNSVELTEKQLDAVTGGNRISFLIISEIDDLMSCVKLPKSY